MQATEDFLSLVKWSPKLRLYISIITDYTAILKKNSLHHSQFNKKNQYFRSITNKKHQTIKLFEVKVSIAQRLN